MRCIGRDSGPNWHQYLAIGREYFVPSVIRVLVPLASLLVSARAGRRIRRKHCSVGRLKAQVIGICY